MEELFSRIQGVPPEHLALFFGGLGLVTATGFFPNNNDLTLAGAGIVAAQTEASIWPFFFLIFCGIALGESMMFTIGSRLGGRALNHPFILKKLPPAKQSQLCDVLNASPTGLLIAARLSPVFRPFLILTLGGLGLRPGTFFPRYLPILFCYCLLITQAFYLGGPVIQEHFAGRGTLIFIIALVLWVSFVSMIGRRILKALSKG